MMFVLDSLKQNSADNTFFFLRLSISEILLQADILSKLANLCYVEY